MVFFHLPPVFMILPCTRKHSNSPHHIACSHPKTLLKFTTILDADRSVDHKITQAFPSCVDPQRAKPVGNRAYPCGYQFCVFQGTTKLISSPAQCPQASMISKWKRASHGGKIQCQGDIFPMHPNPWWGDPHLATSVDVPPAQETPVLSPVWKPSVVVLFAKGLFYFLKEEIRVTTTSIVRSKRVALTSVFLTGEEEIQDLADAGFAL